MLKENLKMNSPGTGAYVKVIRDALRFSRGRLYSVHAKAYTLATVHTTCRTGVWGASPSGRAGPRPAQ
jgi:hypothetical protein